VKIAEHYRFAEENPADSRVFFRIKVKFRDLAEPDGADGAGGGAWRDSGAPAPRAWKI
jgi:hypothetical protein